VGLSAAQEAGGGGRFDERPLEIAVDIRRHPAGADRSES
jgi:hypothetical protein